MRLRICPTRTGPNGWRPLWPILRTCTVDSYRESFANLLARFGMFDSVPGPNIIAVVPPAEGVPEPGDVERYTAVLQRQATPYMVDDRRRATPSAYPETAASLTPSTGLVTTVLDLAKFDLALKQGIIVTPQTLAQAWTAPANANGVALPHGIGWFVQNYNGEKVVWQFGHDGERVIVDDDHAAVARAHVDHDGEQRWPGEVVFADERRRVGVAVCTVVFEFVRPVDADGVA